MSRTILILLIFLVFSIFCRRNLYIEPVGKVELMRNYCAKMSKDLYISFNNVGPNSAYQKRITDFPTEISTEIRKLLENQEVQDIFVDLKAQTICISTPKIYSLNRIEDAGKFSSDLKNYEFFKMPKFWAELETGKFYNVNLENCEKLESATWQCRELDLRQGCILKSEGIEEHCGEIEKLDSSDKNFAFSRQLSPNTHIIATRVQMASRIKNGNIFKIENVPILGNIVKMHLEEDQMMSIGNIIVKNEMKQ
ncbi:unnamed protein product [Caenorhabditis angaria]|uniref:Flagella basal body P-ring formation protein FlgA n=1 Tax=Caenorhabditis angaria TaxID=860376 RepID=A0A9P1ISM3_9PELO|nr:unnamed protein product [Caenorhabditis angaria]